MAVSGERRSWETARSSAVLTVSASAQRRRLDHPAQQPLTLERRAQQRLERRHHALLQPAQAGLGGVGSHQQRPQPRGALAQRERDPALVTLDRLHLDRRRAQLQRMRQPCRGGGQGLGEVVSAQQEPRHLCGQIGLASAGLRIARPGARDLCDRAHQSRRYEEGDQGDPVARAPDLELPDRGQVEEVERRRAQHRREGAQPCSPDRGDDEHGQQVHDAERDDRGDLLERVDQQRAQRRGGHRHEHSRPPRRRLGGQQEAERSHRPLA